MDELIARVVKAHGGAERWRALTRIELDFTATGFLFAMKRRPTLGRRRILISTREPRATLLDFPSEGQRGEWIANERVRIFDANDTVIAEREHPRRSGGLGLGSWDDLDLLYFSSYAMWNYACLPLLLMRDDVTIERLSPSGGHDRVAVTFPAAVPTHCARQVFWFSSNGELVRHDYKAEVVAFWATAAHLCAEHRDLDGLRIPTHRRVQPKLLGSPPLPFPIIVAIDVHGLVVK